MAYRASKRMVNETLNKSYPVKLKNKDEIKSEPVSEPEPEAAPEPNPEPETEPHPKPNITLKYTFPKNISRVILKSQFNLGNNCKLSLLKPGKYSVYFHEDSESLRTTGFVYTGQIRNIPRTTKVELVELCAETSESHFSIVYQYSFGFAIIEFNFSPEILVKKKDLIDLDITTANNYEKLHFQTSLELTSQITEFPFTAKFDKTWSRLHKTFEFVIIKLKKIVLFETPLISKNFDRFYKFDEMPLVVNYRDSIDNLSEQVEKVICERKNLYNWSDSDESDVGGYDGDDESNVSENYDLNVEENNLRKLAVLIRVKEYSNEKLKSIRKMIRDDHDRLQVWPSWANKLSLERKQAQTELIFVLPEPNVNNFFMSEISTYRYHLQDLVVHRSEDTIILDTELDHVDVDHIKTVFPSLTKLTFFAVDNLISFDIFLHFIKRFPKLTQLVLFIGDDVTMWDYYRGEFWQLIKSLKSLRHLVLPFDYGWVMNYEELSRWLPESLDSLYVKCGDTLNQNGTSSISSLSRNKLKIPNLFEANRYYQNDSMDNYVNTLAHFKFDSKLQRYKSTAQISVTSVDVSDTRIIEIIDSLKFKFNGSKMEDLTNLNLELFDFSVKNPRINGIIPLNRPNNLNDILDDNMTLTRLRISQPSLHEFDIEKILRRLERHQRLHSVEQLTLYHFIVDDLPEEVWKKIGQVFPNLKSIIMEECIDFNWHIYERQPLGACETSAHDLTELAGRCIPHLQELTFQSSLQFNNFADLNKTYTY